MLNDLLRVLFPIANRIIKLIYLFNMFVACDSSSTYKDNKVIRATTIKQINGTGMIELILPYIERFI